VVVVSNFWVQPQKAIAPEPALASTPARGTEASARAN